MASVSRAERMSSSGGDTAGTLLTRHFVFRSRGRSVGTCIIPASSSCTSGSTTTAWRVVHTLIEAGELWIIARLVIGFAPWLGPLFYARLVRFLFDSGSTLLDVFVGIFAAIGLDDNSDRIRTAKTMIEQEFEKIAIEINAGSFNEREHFYAFRSQDCMLSSLIHEQQGELSFQKEVSIATLGPNVSVFVNKPPRVPDFGKAVGNTAKAFGRGIVQDFEFWKTIPGAFDLDDSASPETGEILHAILIPLFADDILGTDGPGLWFGQTSNPLVWQHENVSIAIAESDCASA